MLYAKITSLTAGWPYDQAHVNELYVKYLKSFIPVDSIDIQSSRTYVYLKDVKRASNSVNFTFYVFNDKLNVMEEYDIFDNMQKLTNIHSSYALL